MKHILIGGDGFVGRYIARDLLKEGERVLVCDINKSPIPIYDKAEFQHVDITDTQSLAATPIEADDVVYNVAARMLHPIVPRKERREFFFSVDYEGAVNVVDLCLERNCDKLIQFSTDMVYGRLQTDPPVSEDHPRVPLGEYSESKMLCEDYCISKRAEGLRVSIFRPRLIIGPSRLGILTNLFRLIRAGMPVPMIGNGSNQYQMISVFDCASAAIASVAKGVVNGEYNLGSENPPTVRELLGELVRRAHSRSILVPTPAGLVKSTLRFLDAVNLSLLVPEQYEIADESYIVDIERAIQELDWRPKDSDQAMMNQAYDDFVSGRKSESTFQPA
jgi:dTDP-glucose 4,6-dehydratase